MVHVQQVEDVRRKRGVRDVRGLGIKIRKVPVMDSTETTMASLSSQGSKMGNRVLGILILTGVIHQGEAHLSPRREMEVIYSVQRRIVLSVSELIVESADMSKMPDSVVVRVDTWSDTVLRIKVRLEVMLSLGLTHKVQQQSSLQRGTDFMP